MACDEHDGDLRIQLGETPLKVETAAFLQAHVEHQATGSIHQRPAQKSLCRCIHFHPHPRGPHQARQRLPNGIVVVDDEHDRCGLGRRRGHEVKP